MRIRAALIAGTALAMLLAAFGGAEARSVVHGRHEQARKERPKPLQVPLITISLSNQRLTLYDKGEVVAHAPVSTGMQGHPTPTGVFSVLEKEIFHRSNIYSGAPMPYMQRITWSGVALHAGVLPGYPASHGCIRMPRDFAVKLFGLTQRGARVIVSRGEVTPVAFDSPHLFTSLGPTDITTGELAPTGSGPAVKTAETKTPAVMSDAFDAAAHRIAGINKPAPGQPAVAAPATAGEGPRDAHPSAIEGAHAEAIQKVAGELQKSAPGIAAKDAAGVAVNGAAPAVPAAVLPALSHAALEATNAAVKDHEAVNAGASAPGAALVKPATVPAQPIEVNKTFDPAGVSAAPGIGAVPAPAPAPQAALEPYGPERPLRPGPITVFVSRKEGKVFVRKGFQQILAEPVTIAHPELALGTHIFTAVAAKPGGTSFDWVQVSVPTSSREARVVRTHRGRRIEKSVTPAAPPPATAAEALDRIAFPPDAMWRISSLMSPGATLIVSDQGLGPETGLETDFVVLTH